MLWCVWCIFQGKARSDMTVEERIGSADRRKMEGNILFKEEKLEEAMQQYEMVAGLEMISLNFRSFYIHSMCRELRLYSFISSGHSVHGRRLYVPTIWEVSQHGLGCEESLPPKHGSLLYKAQTL